MEVVGQGLQALGSAVTAIAVCGMFAFITLMGSITFLMYTGKIKYEEMKEMLDRILPKKKKRM